jgi:hypothetical protein
VTTRPGGDEQSESTRGVASSNVPGGSRVSAEASRDPTVREERFLRYVDGILLALDLDPEGEVVEVILRSILESVRLTSRGEYYAVREAVSFGVGILRRKPELLVDLLLTADGYEQHRVLVMARELTRDELVQGLVRDAVVRVADPPPQGPDP